MSKYLDPFDSTNDLFKNAVAIAGLNQYLNVVVLVDNKAKKLFAVVKANDREKHRTDDDLYIILNEAIFDQLTIPQQLIVIDEILSTISYDVEKSKLSIIAPDVITYSAVLSKHTFETWNVIRESVKSLYDKERGEEAQAQDEAENATTSTAR